MSSRLQYFRVPLEVKALKEREFEGHGAVFGNVDLGGDVVLPGAFKRTLLEHKRAGTLPAMFWMHRPDQVPGKWLDVDEDDEGLAMRGVLAPTPLGDEMHALMDMKAVRGLSIGYRARDVDYDSDGNRLLKDVDLWEASIVSLAMNPLARVEAMKATQLSAAGEYVPSARELEHHFVDMGCSKSVARGLVAKVFGGAGGMPGAGGGTPPADSDADAAAAINELAATFKAATLETLFYI